MKPVARSYMMPLTKSLSLSLFLCFFCRACEVGGSLCNMSKGRYKNCQQREAQWVGANEGNFLMGDLEKKKKFLAQWLLFHAKLISLIMFNKHPCQC